MDYVIEDYASYSDKGLQLFNTNADMAFIPSYPGSENRLDLSGGEMYSVEFLGRTNDLGKIESRTVTNVDPYMDEDQMNRTDMFGRVYEDCDQEWIDSHRTVRTFNNPAFRSDSFQQSFVWEQSLSGEGDLIRDYDNVRLILMNATNLGKNPYIVADLTAMEDGISAEYSDNFPEEWGSGSFANEHVSVKSTVDPLDKYDIGSNRIRWIGGITARFDRDSQKIVVTFDIPPTKDGQYVHMDTGKVRMIVFNQRDMSLFEKFHVLDPYGFVNILSASKTVIRNIIRGFENNSDQNRGWGVYYDTNAHSEEELSQLVNRYYVKMGEFGGLDAGFMDEVQLSDFSELSDVYVFQGHDRLSFKYSDEDVFDFGNDHYYFPVLNHKYPKTLAKEVEYKIEKNLVRLDEDEMGFNEGNTFVVRLDDPGELVEDIGGIVIGIDKSGSDTVMVFEDFMDPVPSSDNLYNFDIYNSTDGRNCMFIQCTENEISSLDLSSLDVEDQISRLNALSGLQAIVSEDGYA